MNTPARWAALGGIALALALTTFPAAAQEPAGPILRGGFRELELGGRVQTQLSTTTVDEEAASEIFLRRVRLEARVRINQLVSGRISPEFAGDRVSIKDAFLRLDLHPALGILAGKAYRPFGLLEQTSSTRILPIERGVAIRGLDGFDEYELVHDLQYSDRDIGIQLVGAPEGAPLGFSWAAGVFRGPLQGRIGEETSYQLAARATVAPLPDLRLGLGVSNRDFGQELGPERFATDRGTAYEVDLEYGAFDPGLHLLAELAVGDFDPFADRDFLGAQAWAGYRTRPWGRISTVEPIVRISYGTVDSEPAGTGDAGGTLVTPGVNVYFGGLNRLQLNYDLWRPNDDGAGEGSFKAQFQLAF